MADGIHLNILISLCFIATYGLWVNTGIRAAPPKSVEMQYLLDAHSFPDGVTCKTQSDCPNAMCCVHNPLTKPDTNKRFVFGQYSDHDHGFCRRARRFNESCYPLSHDSANPELYDYFCPCESGLDCRGLVVHETETKIIHRYPTCQSPESNLLDNGPTPSGVACSSDGECGSGMCCVRYPRSRKRQQSSYNGYCRNEGKLNETCDRHDFGTHDFHCPCQSGLECRGASVLHFNHQTVHEGTVCLPPAS
ncbi:uncharacterized protein LOC132746519 isoform X2 [Ruditapes philippinarum]|uniref:uncharacterized protein LOC132746519 isoform X2 n=1 Tax=Ruditapes philippinarum TaxID=129788 RepID=UPI00295B3636|nr:uncharacterized protein LOC132746519 isoform X2 [Ruditapes philippinarum]